MAQTIYGVVEINVVASQTNNALVRTAVNMTDDIPEGSVFNLNTLATGRTNQETWVATQPATATGLNNLWMANGLINVTTDGVYRNIDPNPQHYVNTAGIVFDAFQPQRSDLLTLTAECLAGTFVSGTTNFVNASNGTYQLTWGNAQTADALSMAYIGTGYISIGNGALGSTQRVTAYKFNVLAN